MGCGFIGFKDSGGAEKALKSIHNYALVDTLHVLFTGRGTDDED